jgi:hypothetical protein
VGSTALINLIIKSNSLLVLAEADMWVPLDPHVIFDSVSGTVDLLTSL